MYGFLPPEVGEVERPSGALNSLLRALRFSRDPGTWENVGTAFAPLPLGLAALLSGPRHTIEALREGPVRDAVETLSLVPTVVGDVASLALVPADIANRDWLSAGLNALGIIPFIPALGTVAARRAASVSPSVADAPTGAIASPGAASVLPSVAHAPTGAIASPGAASASPRLADAPTEKLKDDYLPYLRGERPVDERARAIAKELNERNSLVELSNFAIEAGPRRARAVSDATEARRILFGYTTPVYHGTLTPRGERLFTQFDPNRGEGFAVRVGTPMAARERLNWLQERHSGTPHVLPLFMRADPRRMIETKDLGGWSPRAWAKFLDPHQYYPDPGVASVIARLGQNEADFLQRLFYDVSKGPTHYKPNDFHHLLQTRLDVPAPSTISRYETREIPAAAIVREALLARNIDTIRYRNDAEDFGSLSYAVLRPELLRHQDARFDPVKIGISRELLASPLLPALGLGGLLAIIAGQAEQ